MMEEIKVLDKGFIKLVDKLGDDNRVVQSARVSVGSGVMTYRKDRTLIRYLIRHEHWSPFEQVSFVFHIKMPIFVARQINRYRTGKLNEISARYSVFEDEYYIPEKNRIQKQNKMNRQGSEGQIEEKIAEKIIQKMESASSNSFENYNSFIENGLAREEARIVLPVNTYTQWFWQMDLRNLFNFLKQRMDWHAQWETQEYARAVYKIIKEVVPICCEAFDDYILNAKKFSKQEMEIIKKALAKINEEDLNILNELEIEEFKEKLS